MTLKEKFFDAIFDGLYMYKPQNVLNDSLKIADDYAIEFAEWMSENYSTYYHELSIWNKDHKKYSNKELLEIFKKEKQL